MPSLADCIRLACRAEVLARKPGNVHPEAAFDDLRAADFLRAADAASPWLAEAGRLGVGRAVFEAVRATRECCASNVNLGICLLIAPCAAADRDHDFRESIEQVLAGLTIDDAAWVYRAIRVAAPGGLGEANEQDVAEEPTVTLRDAMQLAAVRDGVAAQYANGFRDVRDIGVRNLVAAAPQGVETAIVLAHLNFMAAMPDTLIARKCGEAVARESAEKARAVLNAGWPSPDAQPHFEEFDVWLRADGHRRNPGTSADLVAASLFVALWWMAIDPARLDQWIAGRVSTCPLD